MSTSPVFFSVNFREGVVARVWLNDLPLHTFLMHGPHSMAGGANHWLVPGQNTIDLEIYRVQGEHQWDANIEFLLYTVEDVNAYPLKPSVLYSATFPSLWANVPEEGRVLPYMHREKFDMAGIDLVEPLYYSAEPASYGCDGTPELREALKELHDSLSDGNADRFLKLTALKGEEYERAFHGAAEASAAEREEFIREIFVQKLHVRPLDFSRIHFEPRAGGRVAYVSGADNEPALEAISSADPALRLAANPLFTRYNGAWRVFA